MLAGQVVDMGPSGQEGALHDLAQAGAEEEGQKWAEDPWMVLTGGEVSQGEARLSALGQILLGVPS